MVLWLNRRLTSQRIARVPEAARQTAAKKQDEEHLEHKVAKKQDEELALANKKSDGLDHDRAKKQDAEHFGHKTATKQDAEHLDD